MATAIFIPLISLFQILLEYLKTPEYTIFFLQSDPLRRFEIWRLVTPALIHNGQEDGSNDLLDMLHLWGNVLCQLFFGWSLEKQLGWRSTFIIYFSSALFVSLFSAAVQPCFSKSVGASDAILGLIAAHLSGHLMMGQRHPGLRWKSVWLNYICWIAYPLLGALSQEVATVLKMMGPFDKAAHAGGTLGGFLAGIYVWQKAAPLRPYQMRNYISEFCNMFALSLFIASCSMYIYYEKVLSGGVLTIKPNLRNYLLDTKLYVPFSQRICNLYWNGNANKPVLFEAILHVMDADAYSKVVFLPDLVFRLGTK